MPICQPLAEPSKLWACPPLRRHWTTEDVRALMDESRPSPRYELIDGELIVTPSPGNPHQVVVGELHFILASYLEREPVGLVFASPADLELRKGTITQPDVFVVLPGDGTSTDVTGWSSVRSLLLAIEVISPTSVCMDRVTKREYYMNVGVPDYLVVDREAHTIERWSPERDTPQVLRDQLVWRPSGASESLIRPPSRALRQMRREGETIPRMSAAPRLVPARRTSAHQPRVAELHGPLRLAAVLHGTYAYAVP